MTTSIGWASLDVIPSLRGAQASLERESSSVFGRVGRSAGRTLGDTAGREASSTFASRFKSGLGSTQALLAGAGIGGALFDLIGQASDAEQSIGGVSAIFGEYAAQVQASSEKAAQAVGLSANAYRELATLSGSLLKSSGLTDYADQADNLIRVGADLAATFGGSTKDAVDALNSALKGEADPAERYALRLNETAVNARLAATGAANLKGKALDLAKVQARLALITEGSADSLGAFGREADTQAGQAQRASAQFADLRAELGSKFLPAATTATEFVNDKALPALSGLGGAAEDAAKFFGSLPGPVKTAAGAFVALKAAQSLGISSAILGGYARLSTSLDTVRIRGMLAADAYRAQTGAAGAATGANARLAGSYAAVQAGAQGAAGAAGAFVRAVAPLAIITAGITLYSKLKETQQESTEYVEALTAALVEQNGVITASVRQIASNELENKGLLKAAQDLGLDLTTVTEAALGSADALKALQEATADKTQGAVLELSDGLKIQTEVMNDSGKAATSLIDDLRALANDSDSATAAAKRRYAASQDVNAAEGENVSTTRNLREALKDYTTNLDEARSAVRELMDAEKERLEQNVDQRRDRLALFESIRAAQKQARIGKDGLDDETGRGAQNIDTILDIIERFNGASAQVRNTPGLFAEVRSDLRDVIKEMGGGRKDVQEYLGLLATPANASKSIRFKTPGLQQALSDVERLSQLIGNGIDDVEVVFGRGGQRATPSAQVAELNSGIGQRNPDVGGSQRPVYNGPVYLGNVTYTDEEQGRRRAQQRQRRAASDGVRRQ